MELHDEAKEYWQVINRVNRHEQRPMLLRAAVNDLTEIAARTKSDAVRKRCYAFIGRNHQYSLGNPGGGTGPRTA